MHKALIALLVIAASIAPAAADPTYPVTSADDWLGNTQRDMTDFGTGQHAFESGIWGAIRRTVQRVPARAGDPPPELLQAIIDDVLHDRPDLPFSHWGDAGHPDLMPDWDHDGAFGDGGGFGLNGEGDFDADTDEVLTSAYFPLPCFDAADGWEVRHLTPDGTCDLTGQAELALGVAREVRFINQRGLVLDGTVWVPMEATAPGSCPARGSNAYADLASWETCVTPQTLRGSYPAVVFANGISSRQELYYWFAMRMVAEGMVVFTYDPAGQGESEGTWIDTFDYAASNYPTDCRIPGACLDLEDAAHFFVGNTIVEVPHPFPRVSPRKDPSGNAPSPVAGIVDRARLAVAGNSMGAISTLHYLNAAGAGADGRPLPPVASAVVLSGAAPTRADVPIQFQTSDFDGSPTLVGPSALGIFLGFGSEGIGYYPMKALYEELRADDDHAPMSLLVFEGGTHTDHTATPYVPRTIWSIAYASDYAAAHLRCTLLADAAACDEALTPQPHLSKAFASEHDPDGPSPSLCIAVPTEAFVNQSPTDLVAALGGSPNHSCID